MVGKGRLNREEYMALRDVFLKRYGDENLYHITNVTAVTRISIVLGAISILFFLLIFIPVLQTPVKSNIYNLKKIMLIALLVIAFIITFINLWSLM
jgi:hypothetical protein